MVGCGIAFSLLTLILRRLELGLVDATWPALGTADVAAKEHGAVSFGASPLRLAPFVREHYLGFLGAAFPRLLAPHERAYATANAPPADLTALDERVAAVRARYGFADDPMRRSRRVLGPPNTPDDAPARAGRQLALDL